MADLVPLEESRWLMKTMTRRDRRHLRELERQGLIRVGTMKAPKGFLDAPRPRLIGSGLSETLVEERRDSR